MSDTRFPGVAVYAHVRPDITDALADALLALDGVQQCDLAAALARRNPRMADALSTTIGDAVAAGLGLTRSPTGPAIDEAVQIILALTTAELATFAQRLAVANSPHAYTVADAILDAVYDVTFPVFPPGNMPWCGQCALPVDICRGHDDEYGYQVAWAQ